MTCNAHVHVGDIGTIYRAPVADEEGQSFDPSEATTIELIFLMPNGIVLHKTATVTTIGSPAEEWFLEYQVQPGDGVGSPGEFHDNAGPIKMQGFLAFPDGSQFHSEVIEVDSDNQELRIFPNLD